MISYLSDTEELDRALASVKHTLLGVYLLHQHFMRHLVEIVGQRRSLPMLVSFGVRLLQFLDILCHFLQHFLLEAALLLRACIERAVGNLYRRSPICSGAIIELHLLRRAGRRLHVLAGGRGIAQHALHGGFSNAWHGERITRR